LRHGRKARTSARRPDCLTYRRFARETCERPPAYPPGRPSPGITGSGRFLAAISGRFSCGICAGCEQTGGRYGNTYADSQDFYGSDGTRTRDLRRDRPVLALTGWLGISGHSLCERDVSPVACGDCPAPELPAASCGICAGCVVVLADNYRELCGQKRTEQADYGGDDRRRDDHGDVLGVQPSGDSDRGVAMLVASTDVRARPARSNTQ
jgi:hypothetical protein